MVVIVERVFVLEVFLVEFVRFCGGKEFFWVFCKMY